MISIEFLQLKRNRLAKFLPEIIENNLNASLEVTDYLFYCTVAYYLIVIKGQGKYSLTWPLDCRDKARVKLYDQGSSYLVQTIENQMSKTF